LQCNSLKGAPKSSQSFRLGRRWRLQSSPQDRD